MPSEPAIQNWRVIWGLRLFVYAIPGTLLALGLTFVGLPWSYAYRLAMLGVFVGVAGWVVVASTLFTRVQGQYVWRLYQQGQIPRSTGRQVGEIVFPFLVRPREEQASSPANDGSRPMTSFEQWAFRTFSGWNAVTITISVLSVAFFVFVAIRVLGS